MQTPERKGSQGPLASPQPEPVLFIEVVVGYRGGV